MYKYITYIFLLLFQNSLAIVEDASEKSIDEVRKHLKKVATDFYKNPNKPDNPWLEELWRHKSGCPDIKPLKDCSINNTNLEIDTKVYYLIVD